MRRNAAVELREYAFLLAPIIALQPGSGLSQAVILTLSAWVTDWKRAALTNLSTAMVNVAPCGVLALVRMGSRYKAESLKSLPLYSGLQ